MNKTFRFFVILLLVNTSVFAEEFSISLANGDTSKFASLMSKLNYKYRTQEVINDGQPNWYILKRYKYLDSNFPFWINCSEEFYPTTSIGINGNCTIGFDYSHSSNNEILAKDGFSPYIAYVEIRNSLLAKDLYDAIGNGTSPSSFFNSKEMVPVLNPQTGSITSFWRLRIDCQRNQDFSQYFCKIVSIKNH